MFTHRSSPHSAVRCLSVKIAVYGASGYQGKLVLAELARRSIDMLIVGRDGARLRTAATTAGVAGAEQRVAGTDDLDALVAAFRDVDAVINCAGPFTSSGHAVIRATIAAGCHYVDTSGEQLYTKGVFDTFADEAERAGKGDRGVPGGDPGTPVALVVTEATCRDRVDRVEHRAE